MMPTLTTLKALTQATYGFPVIRATEVFTGISNTPIYNIVGGRVAVRSIIGQITIGASAAMNISLRCNPTAAGTEGPMSTALAANGLEVGTLITIDGAVGVATFGVNAGAAQGQLRDSIVPIGQIEFVVSTGETISVGWLLHYVSIDVGAYVTVV